MPARFTAPVPVLTTHRLLELDYRQQPTPSSSPRAIRLIFLLACAPAAVVPFVPFTYVISPAEAVIEFFRLIGRGDRESYLFLVLLAVPFFLGIFITIWQLRLLIRPRLSDAERVVLYLMAACSAVMSACFAGVMFYLTRTDEWTEGLYMCLLGPATLAGGAVLIWWMHRRGARAMLPILAMEIAYLANAGMCLVAFSDDREIGWWLTVAVAAGMAAELAIAAIPRCRAAGGFTVALSRG